MFEWLCPKKTSSPSILFKAGNGTPYSLKVNSIELCSGHIDNSHVCTFEDVKFDGETLKVGHFALHDPYIGKGMAVQFLKSFATTVLEPDSRVMRVEFELKKSTTETMSCEKSLIKLANAREQLLFKIGAENIRKEYLSRVSWQVTGIWPRIKW